ncbi:Spartin [Armadillidium vulgare]|nr:Spartin [Armadillidium vulgare]
MCYPLQARNGNTASPMVTPVMSPQNGEMIFQIENGVQIFFIYANGRVTSPSYPSFLSIFTFPEPICSNEQSGWPGARGFLQVGEWSYPLVPSQSPVLHSFYGAYMFPDAANPEPGASVGILIPDTVSKDELEMFEQILSQMTSYQEQKVPSGVDAEEERAKVAKSSGQRIAEGLVSGSGSHSNDHSMY